MWLILPNHRQHSCHYSRKRHKSHTSICNGKWHTVYHPVTSRESLLYWRTRIKQDTNADMQMHVCVRETYCHVTWHPVWFFFPLFPAHGENPDLNWPGQNHLKFWAGTNGVELEYTPATSHYKCSAEAMFVPPEKWKQKRPVIRENKEVNIVSVSCCCCKNITTSLGP